MLEELKQILYHLEIRSFGICDFHRLAGSVPSRKREQIPAQAKSVIVCAFPYYSGEYSEANLCKYAMLPDYHQVCGEILTEACRMIVNVFGGNAVWFTDTSPLLEQECAVLSGIGFTGRNNLVIHPQYGTYFTIGEIVTDIAFPCSEPNRGQCLDCGRCSALCPGGVLRESPPDYAHCLSALTQKKGTLEPQDALKIKQNGLVWGCDICQDCCPHNRHAVNTHLRAYRQVTPVVTQDNLPSLMKTHAFGYRGLRVMERNLRLLSDAEGAGAK